MHASTSITTDKIRNYFTTTAVIIEIFPEDARIVKTIFLVFCFMTEYYVSLRGRNLGGRCWYCTSIFVFEPESLDVIKLSDDACKALAGVTDAGNDHVVGSIKRSREVEIIELPLSIGRAFYPEPSKTTAHFASLESEPRKCNSLSAKRLPCDKLFRTPKSSAKNTLKLGSGLFGSRLRLRPRALF
jgi:hypothetical protein